MLHRLSLNLTEAEGAGFQACPLCLFSRGNPLRSKEGRDYLDCPRCGLVWMLPQGRLSANAELAHYKTHENSPHDPGYRRFLSQLWRPLKAKLPTGAQGLDYGSGPGPTLHLMAEEDGFACTHYDPFFAPEEARLATRYDFIACSETAEHFHCPAREFGRLAELLHPGGWLGIMTLRLASVETFPGWYYHRDPTHVCFYRDRTFQWIAGEFGFEDPQFVNDRVTLLKRR